MDVAFVVRGSARTLDAGPVSVWGSVAVRLVAHRARMKLTVVIRTHIITTTIIIAIAISSSNTR